MAENWEVLPDNAKYKTPPFFAYFDEGYTKEYTYPGDGIDYTFMYQLLWDKYKNKK